MATKLYYFDARGRAEICRLTLAAAGKKFEDIRFSRDEWVSKYKAEAPFGQVPFIEYDGEKYAQSVAIATFFARQNNLYGDNELEGLRIGEVVGLVQDATQSMVRIFREEDPAKKEELKKKIAEEDLPKFFGFFQKLLQKNGTGYFVGNKLSLADIIVFDQAYSVKQNFNYDAEANFPEIRNLVSKVESNENIKAYLAIRKVTNF